MSKEQQMVVATNQLAFARQLNDVLLDQYVEALKRSDWKTADEIRVKCLASFEAILDQLAAAHRTLQEP
jgi:hypothetical protein